MKKVLISLGELQDLLKASYHECCWKDGIPEFTNEHAIKWFDAQPDASDPHEIREGDQEKYREWLCPMLKENGYEENAHKIVPSIFHWVSIGRPKAALSKMETTGGKE